MDCNRVSELIMLYLDNELDNAEKALFEEHIKACESCCNDLNEYKTIITLCKDISDEELPEDFKESLHKKLMEVKVQMGSNEIKKKSSENKKNSARFIQIISSIAAVVLVFVFFKGMTGLGGFGGSKSSDMSMEMAAKSEAPRAEAKMEEPKMAEPNNDASQSAELKARVAQDSAAYTMTEDSKQAESVEDNDGVRYGALNGEKPAAAEPKYDKAPEEAAKVKALGNANLAAANITNRSTGIEIAAEKPELIYAEVKKLAEAAGAEEYSGGAPEKEEAVNTMADRADNELNLKISNANYPQFEENLKKKYTEGTISFDTLRTEDVSVRINELNIQNAALDSKINDSRKNNNLSSDELAVLEKQKSLNQEQIDSLIKDSEYTVVKIIIRKKQ